MTTRTIIVMADVKSRVALSDQQTIKRHVEYISEFCKLENSENSRLVILQPTLNIFRSKRSILEKLIVHRISILDLLRLRTIFFKGEDRVTLIVAGDPWESYVFAILIKGMLRDKKIPVQLQVHAELSDAWAKLSLGNRVRRWVSFRTLKKSQSVRVVSNEQKRFLEQELTLDSKIISAIPVKLNADFPISHSTSGSRPISIGLVGRIHKERNIRKFIEIASFFLMEIPELRIVIAGDSHRSKRIVDSLRRISSTQVDFLGNLESKQMKLAWSRIGVLISTAESESYGRTIREALMNNVPVLAFSSMGSRDLLHESPDSVRLFTDSDTLSELLEMYRYLLDSRVQSDFIAKQKMLDSEIAHQIAVSWRDAIEQERIR